MLHGQQHTDTLGLQALEAPSQLTRRNIMVIPFYAVSIMKVCIIIQYPFSFISLA